MVCHQHQQQEPPATRAPSPTPTTNCLRELSFTNTVFIQNTQFIQVRKSDLKHVVAHISLPVCTWCSEQLQGLPWPGLGLHQHLGIAVPRSNLTPPPFTALLMSKLAMF